jgi:hypothetical protein
MKKKETDVNNYIFSSLFLNFVQVFAIIKRERERERELVFIDLNP